MCTVDAAEVCSGLSQQLLAAPYKGMTRQGKREPAPTLEQVPCATAAIRALAAQTKKSSTQEHIRASCMTQQLRRQGLEAT
jgi:hypothetical protein